MSGAGEPDAAASHRVEAEQRAQQLRPPSADEAREPEDLSAAQGERGLCRDGVTSEAVELEQHLTAR